VNLPVFPVAAKEKINKIELEYFIINF